MLLAFGMLSAILSSRATGRGQVVDAAMTEGAALLAAMFFNRGAMAGMQSAAGENLLAGAAPFYGIYATADGACVTLASIEPQFYADARTDRPDG